MARRTLRVLLGLTVCLSVSLVAEDADAGRIGRGIGRVAKRAGVEATRPTFEAAGLRPTKPVERELRAGDVVEAEVLDAEKLSRLGLAGLKVGDAVDVEIVSADQQFKVTHKGSARSVALKWSEAQGALVADEAPVRPAARAKP